MSKAKVLFDRFMSAKFLNDSKDVEWNCEHELQDDTHLLIKKDLVDYERVFRYKIASKQAIAGLEDIEISLEVGLEYTGTPIIRDPLSWTVASDQHAIGIQLRDLREYRTLGPYVGVEGTPGIRVLENPGLPGSNEERANTQHWPRYFRITIKPLEKLAVCRTPIDGGHLFTVEYDKYNPTIDITKSDLWLDVYRFDDAESYIINFVKVTVTVIINKK